MKKMKRLISIIILQLLSFLAIANNEVSVVSFGASSTEEKAVKVALRNAVEQAFGTFVSANTVILNDKLISDEIATITRGNIKSFEVIAKSVRSDKVTVSVRAIVSIDNLISYAKSKGSAAEFAGNLYMNNVALMKFRAKNTKDALKVLCNQVRILSADMFDYDLTIEDPKRIRIEGYCAAKCENNQFKIETPYRGGVKLTKDVYGFLVPVNIKLKNNITSSSIYNLIYSTINALKLSDDEVRMCKNVGIDCAFYNVFTSEKEVSLPVSNEFCKKIAGQLNSYYLTAAKNYKVIVTSDKVQVYAWEKLTDIKDISVCRWFSDHSFFDRSSYKYWLMPVDFNLSNRKIIYYENYFPFGGKTSFVWESFRLPEKKIEYKYSEKELKAKKKEMKKNPNYVDTPRYHIEYGAQSVVFEKTIYLFFTENQMNKFSGVKIEKK